MRIPFWKKSSGHLLMAKIGITKDQLKELQELKLGSRLILWLNENAKANNPDYNLRIYKAKK